MRAGFAAAFLFLAAAALASQANAECPKTHPFAVKGVSGDLSTLDKDVSGTIKVLDDCSFEVNLTYNGQGPAAYWYGGKSIEAIGDGVSMGKLDRAYNNEKVIVKLPEGVTWNDTPAISVWCVQFAVDFGSVLLTE